MAREFNSFHRILTADGGFDGLKPGRWFVTTNWLGPKYSTYGETESEAVENLKKLMQQDFPNASWFQRVPVQNVIS